MNNIYNRKYKKIMTLTALIPNYIGIDFSI